MKMYLERTLQQTSSFLRWWATQLQSCAADLVGALSPRRRRVLNVYWHADGLLILDDNSPQPKVIAEIPEAKHDSQWPADIPAALLTVMARSNRARLIVSPDKAFVRQVEVPLAVLPHLDSAIALQLPKLLPLNANELLTDFEVAAGGSSDDAAKIIDIAALKKGDVDPVLSRLQAWGLRIISTHLGEAAKVSRRFRFSADGAFGHRLKLQRSDRILIGVTATLGLACAAVAAGESYRSEVSLERAKADIRTPAAAALVHRQELLARLEPLEALAKIESAPSATALLADVTMLVPQNTFLTTLELKDRRLRIVGVSPNSGNVVKLMSSSQLLNDVELRSSMSLGIGTGLDRFEISAELRGAL
jgi:general secretion pathway protein L